MLPGRYQVVIKLPNGKVYYGSGAAFIVSPLKRIASAGSRPTRVLREPAQAECDAQGQHWS
eukprot:917962-Karenia_brevis.AAC.1